MSERIDIAALERLLATPSGGWRIPEMTSTHAAIPAMLRAIRAAARINELVGTETEEGQAEAWEELDAALAPFNFGTEEPA